MKLRARLVIASYKDVEFEAAGFDAAQTELWERNYPEGILEAIICLEEVTEEQG